MFSEEGKRGVPATFQVVNFIAWKPDPSQKRAATRGSGQVSLKRMPEVTRLMDEMQKLRRSGKTDPETMARIDDVTRQVDKLMSELNNEPPADDNSDPGGDEKK